MHAVFSMANNSIGKIPRYICLLCCLCCSFIQAGWQAPKYVGDASVDYVGQQIVVDSFGNATAIWKDSSGNIAVATLLYGAVSWSGHAVLDRGSLPKIAVDPFGNVTAVWHSDAIDRVQSSTKPYGEPWSTPIPFTGTAGVSFPQVTVDPFGNATALWNTINTIVASTKPYGGSWQPQEVISVEASNVDYVIGAADRFGNVTAVWSIIGSIDRFKSATKNYGEASWSTVVIPISGHAPNQGPSFKMVVDSFGDVTVMWISDPDLVASTKLYGELWQDAPDVVSTDIYDFDIAIDPFGNATAVWGNPAVTVIKASTKPHEGSWQPVPDIVSTGGTSLSIAVDTSGKATAVWASASGDTVASTKSEGVWQAIPDIISTDGLYTNTTNIAFDPLGNATALWWRTYETGDAIQSANNFIPPTVTGISPNIGSTVGGTSVTITGTSFAHVTAVSFGATAATSYTVDSPTQITAVSPAESAGTVDVRVTTVISTSPITTSDYYTYQDPPFTTSIAPTTGSASGGTTVTITGGEFINVIAVYFGETTSAMSASFFADELMSKHPAPSFIVVSPTEIIATSPEGASGDVYITVETIVGLSPINPNCKFTYQSSTVLPPSHLFGKIKKKKHGHHKYLLKAKWKSSSPSPAIYCYRVYKRSRLFDTVPSTSKLFFKSYLKWKSSYKKFSVASVTYNNAESVHKKLKIKHSG